MGHPAIIEQFIPDTQIPVTMLGRVYGDMQQANDEKFQQGVSDALTGIRKLLQDQSRLLTLEVVVSKDEVLEAYGHDLGMLQRHLSEFEACVYQAIRCSIKHHEKHDSGEQWERLKVQIPLIAKSPLLDLDHTLVAQNVGALLPGLKKEFNEGVERLLTKMAFWMQLLVESEYVGLLERTAPDVCRFHYFEHEETEQVAHEDQSTESQEMAAGVEKLTTTTKRATRREQFLERHVHHIAQLKEFGVEEYKNTVPSRVKDFLDKAPVWLKPHLRIMDGRLIKKEALRQKVGEITTIETEVTSQWAYDPAICLGEWCLIGWTEEDLRVTERNMQTAKINSKLEKILDFILKGIVLAIVIGILGFLHHLWKQSKENYRQYDIYYSDTMNGQTVQKVQIGDPMILPAGKKIWYAGTSARLHTSSGDTIDFVWGLSDIDGRWTNRAFVSLPHNVPELYGDISLEQKVGIPVRLHVLKADREHIRYVIAE